MVLTCKRVQSCITVQWLPHSSPQHRHTQSWRCKGHFVQRPTCVIVIEVAHWFGNCVNLGSLSPSGLGVWSKWAGLRWSIDMYVCVDLPHLRGTTVGIFWWPERVLYKDNQVVRLYLALVRQLGMTELGFLCWEAGWVSEALFGLPFLTTKYKARRSLS